MAERPKTRKEHRHCRHYDGQALILTDNALCGAGIDPVKLTTGGGRSGWLKKCPCFEGNDTPVVCEKREFPTWEEIAEQERKMDLAVQATLNLLPQIPADGTAGELECPVCSNVVFWSRAPSNGHVHMQCRSEGCIWMMQ